MMEIKKHILVSFISDATYSTGVNLLNFYVQKITVDLDISNIM